MTVNIDHPHTLKQEEIPLGVAEFKNLVSEADGTLIPLDRRSSQGTELFIAARFVGNPNLADSPDAKGGFWGWDLRRPGIGAFTGAVLVDTYFQEGDNTIPIGHMDWWLQVDYANGGGNTHAAAVPRNDHEQRSLERWGEHYGVDRIAFKVEPEYQGQRIGSLMLAVSSLVLSALGVRKFYSGALLDPAIRTYAHFGITTNDFSKSDEPDTPRWMRDLPIERLSENPRVDKLIEYFLRQDPQI